VREGKFKWVGPLAEKKIGLYAKADSTIKLEKIEEARKFLIGVQRSGHGMQYLKARGFKNFDPSTKPIANLRKLLRGNNDLWFSSNATIAGNCRRVNVKNCQAKIKLVLLVENTFMSIAFNKQTPDSVIDLWQGTYDALYRGGIIKKILKAHGLLSLYPSNLRDSPR
jgi:polar amino acid transport system substrate-binding protein